MFLACVTIAFLSLYLSDLVSPLYPKIGTFGVVALFLSYATTAATAVASFFKECVRPFNRTTYTLGSVVFVLIVLSINIPDMLNVSCESTQQATCALSKLRNSMGSGFDELCFLANRYPNRQYLLTAALTNVFGPRLLVLHIANSIYFIMGLLLFASGLRKYLDQNKIADSLVAFCILAPMCSYFFHLQMLYFEQSFYPISFAFILVGLSFHFLASYKIQWLIALTVVLNWAAFSYTPSLALIALGIPALVYFCYLYYKKNRPTWGVKAFLISLPLLVALITVKTLRGRNDVTFMLDSDDGVLLERFKIIGHFVLNPGFKEEFFLPPGIMQLVLGFLVLCMAGLLGWQLSLLGFWVVGAFLMASLTKGYASPAPPFSMHRAIFIFPILFPMMATAFTTSHKLQSLFQNSSKTTIRVSSFILLLSILGLGLHTHLRYRKDKIDFMKTWFTQNLLFEPLQRFVGQKPVSHLFLDHRFEEVVYMRGVWDCSQYFYPTARLVFLSQECSGFSLNPHSVYVIKSGSRCEKQLDDLKIPRIGSAEFTRTDPPYTFYYLEN